MITNVAPTSKLAYSELNSSGTKLKQKNLILETIEELELYYEEGMTRRQLVEYTRLEVNAISARVNELVADGLLVENGKVKCSTTGRLVGLVGLPGGDL